MVSREAAAENLCYVHGTFIGRFCNRRPEKKARGWIDLCWRPRAQGASTIASSSASSSRKTGGDEIVRPWAEPLANGLDTSATGTPIFTSGVLNAARAPTVAGSSREIEGECPQPFLCLQLIDHDGDAHIACVRDTEHVGHTVDPDACQFFIPRARGGNLRVDLHDLETMFLYIDQAVVRSPPLETCRAAASTVSSSSRAPRRR